MKAHWFPGRLLRSLVLSSFFLLLLASPPLAESPRTILVGGPDNFPPYSFVDPASGEPSGFHVELTRAVGAAMGFDVEVRLAPWHQTRQRLDKGELDVIQMMLRTAERGLLYDFSPHHTIVNYAIFARRDSPSVQSLADLSGKRIVANRSDVSHDYLVQQGFDENLALAPSQVEALKLVADGHYDFTLVSRLSGLHWVRSLGLDNMRTVGEPFWDQYGGFAVKKGEEELLARFSEGLAIVKGDGTYRALYDKWLGGLEPSRVPMRDLVRYGIILLAVGLGLTILAALWFWTLRKQVRARTQDLRHEVQEHRRTEAALKQSEERFRLIFDSTGAAMNTLTKDGCFSMVNPRMSSFLGYSEEELLQMAVDDVTYPADREMTHLFYEQVKAGHLQAFDYEKRFVRKSGSVVWGHVTVVWILDDEGHPDHAIAMVQDITDRKHAEELLRQSEERFRTTVNNAPIILWALDADGFFTMSEGRALASMGLKPGEVVGQSVFDLYGDVHQIRHYVSRALGGEEFSARNEVKGRIFETLWSPQKISTGKVMGIIGLSTDVTERAQAESRLRENQERLNYLSYYDPLTHLPNRVLLHDRLQHAIDRARRTGSKLALLFFDLDRFKTINDSMGHAFGDRVLCKVALRLESHTRRADTLSRFGGDKFILLLEDITDIHKVSEIVQQIQFSLTREMTLDDLQFYPTASIGISHFPDNGDDGDSLIMAAEVAMYRAKELGRNLYQFYMPDMDSHARDRLILEADLRNALEREELLLHYQPQIELQSGTLVGMEALIRWRRGKGDLVPPYSFIPMAEDTGLIVPIGEWVLRTACRQNKLWQDRGCARVPVSVNISARQFRQRDLVDMVKKALEDSALEPRYLHLEITESMIMADINASIAILQELAEMGVHCSIDDFGTGYSSLSYLKRFPISALKIDQSFIRDVTVDANDASIAISIIGLARGMNLNVVAEGVETEEQFDFLKKHGCAQGQGYLFGRPVPPEEIEPCLCGGA
ncbi:MAG: EAL domain-containing protein [Desulfuromonadales bacterium]